MTGPVHRDDVAVYYGVVASRRAKTGPYLPIVSLALVAVIVAITFAVHGVRPPTIFELIGILTKVSVLVFILVFITRPLHALVQSSATAWLLANRRYLGLSFAAWHLVHWPLLTTLMVLVGPAKFWDMFQSIVIPAGTILLVITLMAATSNNRSRQFLGKPLWSAIHTIGIYAIWAWAFRIYMHKLKHPNVHAYVYVYTGLLVAALLLRWFVALTKPRRALTEGGR